jgi:membrane protease subunit HflK
MPWNEPGGNGKQNDPWGGKKDQGPPDLDKLFSDMLKKCRALFVKGSQGNRSQWNSNPSSTKMEMKYIFGFAFATILILWFISGFFIVNPAEETVILRLGRYSDVLQPGLHWFARFIDNKYTVDVQKIYSFPLQGDFLTRSSDQGDLPNTLQEVTGAKADISDQSKNLVNVELTVQYRIDDPRAYLFSVVDPDETIKEVAAGALSDVVGQMKLDEVLTTGREMLSSGVMERIKHVLIPYNAGILVMKVTLRKVQAPDQVRAAFNDVNRADQDKATSIQQALAYASKVVPLAEGVAARTLADANGYQKQVVLVAQANVAKYQAVLKAYTAAPEITRERMYLETMQTVFQNTSKVLVDVNSGSNLIYLPLDKLIKQDLPTKADEDVKTDTQQSIPLLSLNNNDLLNNVGQSMGQEEKNDTN